MVQRLGLPRCGGCRLAARRCHGCTDRGLPARRGRRTPRRAGCAIPGGTYSTGDLLEFLRRAGLDPDDVTLDDPG